MTLAAVRVEVLGSGAFYMVTFSWKGAGSWSRWSFRASGAGCALGMWWSSMPIEHRFWFPIFYDKARHTTSKMAMSPIRPLSWMTRKVHCTTSGVPWLKKTYITVLLSHHIYRYDWGMHTNIAVFTGSLKVESRCISVCEVVEGCTMATMTHLDRLYTFCNNMVYLQWSLCNW